MSVHVIDVVNGILHDHRVILSFERPSFAVLLKSPSVDEHLIPVCFVFLGDQTHPSKKAFCLVIGSATPFSLCIVGNGHAS